MSQKQQAPAPSPFQALAAEMEAEAGLGSGAPITPEDLQRARESAGGFDLARDLQDVTTMFCVLLSNGSVSGVKAKDLYSTVGVGKQWMYDRLGALKSRELIEQPSTGYWRASPGVRASDLRAALEEWAAENKAMVPA